MAQTLCDRYISLDVLFLVHLANDSLLWVKGGGNADPLGMWFSLPPGEGNCSVTPQGAKIISDNNVGQIPGP